MDYSFGSLRGKIVRVRDGVASDFCEPKAWDGSFFNDGAYEAGYFNVPNEVLIDAQGRVVFLAYLGGTFDAVLQGGWGLWRCDSAGAEPTLLGAFGAEAPAYDVYPKPLGPSIEAALGSRDVRRAQGLHLKISKGLDLGDLTMVTHQLYVFAVSPNCCGGTEPPWHTIAYDPATGVWSDGYEDPVPTASYDLDMINANGYTFSTGGNGVRAFFEPIRLDFEAGEFHGGLAFQSLNDLVGGVVNSTALPDFDPGNCGPPIDGITNAAPFNEGGNFNVMSGLYGIAWNDGLVLTSGSVAAHDAFLPNFSLTLLDYDPSNDRADMFHQPYGGCVVVKAPKYTPWNNSFWDSDGTPRNVRQMTPNGTAGTGGDKIVTLKDAEVTTIAEGLGSPVGIDVYPGFMPPLSGVALFFRIDSPVKVLITGPDGRRIGADPDSGEFVNDYGGGGYDSNTNEPHLYGIWNPLPGDYSISTKGTGAGPYSISAFGANLDTNTIVKVSFTGEATVDSASTHQLGVSGEGDVVNRDAPMSCATDVTSAVRIVRGRYLYLPGRRITQAVQLTNVGASPIAGPLSLVADNLKYGVLTAAGNTSCAAPIAPYVNVDVGPDGQLLPGETASVVLEFTDARNVYPSYTPRVLAGPGSR